ncbi:hypothetical protein GRI43_09030 [Altererythrobacter luteolus]|uniref:Rhodanese domain-containing protein n=1 Tax=Pontixanthobacter luteolus TaxID=295089 RepID=A0A6I4V2K6_9SPHN|nr:rhodanese-like domain-containing protein [Pontixanthobacter luteolus]MXP47521.1 hypothetical protein [Pontixanthobacter luteolus]
MRSHFLCLAAVGSFLLASCGASEASAPVADTDTGSIGGQVLTLDAAALAGKLEAGTVHLIDVRTAEEFADSHIAGAVNIPLAQFDPKALTNSDGDEVILYCRTDRRSGIAASELAEHTGRDAVHLDGGIIGWEEAGMPVSK